MGVLHDRLEATESTGRRHGPKPSAEAGGFAEELLSLQRSAGNRAVAGMINQMKSGGSATPVQRGIFERIWKFFTGKGKKKGRVPVGVGASTLGATSTTTASTASTTTTTPSTTPTGTNVTPPTPTTTTTTTTATTPTATTTATTATTAAQTPQTEGSGGGSTPTPTTEPTTPQLVQQGDPVGTMVVAPVPDPVPTVPVGTDTGTGATAVEGTAPDTATAPEAGTTDAGTTTDTASTTDADTATTTDTATTDGTGATTGTTTTGTDTGTGTAPETVTAPTPTTTPTASEAAPPANVSEALAKPGLTFKQRVQLACQLFTPTMADLKPAISSASQADRDTIWSDSQMIAVLKSKLSAQDYLDLLVTLRAFQPGTPAEGGGAHTKPNVADTYIRDKLSVYVTDAARKGRKIEGLVAVVGGTDWDAAGIAHYGAHVWNGGKKDAINGFVDGHGRVWIERNSGNAGTMIHEGLHKYSDGAFLNHFGFNANEGATEWFTRKIGGALNPPITRGNYESNFLVIKKLVELVTEPVVAAAYFDGKLEELRRAVLDKSKAWDTFKTEIKAGNWVEATSALT